MTGFDVAKNFDRGSGAGGGDHEEVNLWGIESRFISPASVQSYIPPPLRGQSRKTVELGFGTN